MNTTTEILSVDGVVLNTLAKNIESIAGRLHVPGKRTVNQTLPGRHGNLSVSGKRFEANTIVLPMWVRGCDDDGLVPPGGSAREQFYENLDVLSNLFMLDGLRDVRHTLPDGSIRQCWAEVLEAIDFSVIGRNPLGKFSIEMEVPDVFWQDVDSRDQVVNVVGPYVHCALFDGTTAPIVDSVITFQGPCATMSLVDQTTQEWVQYTAALGAGEQVIVDCSDWSATKNGVDVIANISHSDDYFLPLTPNQNRQVWVSLIAPGNGVGTQATISARRKYLVG